MRSLFRSKDAGTGDYVALNVQEGGLAAKIAEAAKVLENIDRLKLTGTMLAEEFDAFRTYADKILDLDLSDLTIKGQSETANSIPENAFAPKQSGGTSILRSIILPQNLVRIDENAFSRCINLQQITIPASVKSVGNYAFSSCTALTKIIMEGSTPPTTGSMSPFPADVSRITLEVPEGAASTAGFWTLIAPQVPKTYGWIRVDPTRGYSYSISNTPDLTNIDLSTVGQSVSVGLPNCPAKGKLDLGIYRKGLIFKLYDNGNEITSGFEPDQYGYGGQYSTPMKDRSGQITNPTHELDIVFYYPITFENGEGADDVKVEFDNLAADDKYTVTDMSKFIYGDNSTKTGYKEDKEYRLRLTTPSPDLGLSVKVETDVMVKPRTSTSDPVYETITSYLIPDQEGIYTLPVLNGDTRVFITGKMQVPVSEGDTVDSDILTDIDEEEAAEITELAITGELDDDALKALQEKFTSVETLDLSGVESNEIPKNAFEGMTSITSVVLSDAVTEIGAGSFKDCENLTTLTLPNVVAIGEGAFEGCNSLTSIIIPAAGTGTAPANAPARVRARVANGTAITAASFEGMNRNCLIYAGGDAMTGVEGLNILVSVELPESKNTIAEEGDEELIVRNYGWVATKDIVLDGDYPFSVPSEFSLGGHTISFTIGIPGSLGADEYGGWRGIILPFTPTKTTIDTDYDSERGSEPYFVSFENGEAERLTEQTEFVANRPYLASVAAPEEFVYMTFSATGTTIPITPMTDAITTEGKNFSLIGSFDGETTIGTCYELNENGDAFVPTGERKASVRPFGAYLLANDGRIIEKFEIGEHPLWIFDPVSAGVSGTQLYLNSKIELTSETNTTIPSARIYYTLDGSDPSDPKNSARREYAGALNRTSDTMSVTAVTNYKNQLSDVVTLNFELKNVNATYDLANNWNWVSHNQEKAIPLSDFLSNGMTRVQSQTQEAIRYGDDVIGTLTEVEPAVTYKVYTEGGSVYTVNDVAFDPTAPVQLRAGYNWIGCPIDDASLLIEDLFANLKVEDGDMLIGLEGYAQAEAETTADAEGKWYGTLQSLTTNGGYIYYSKSDKELVYNFAPVRDTEAQPAKVVSNAPWAIDIHKYASVMPVTACLVDEDGSKADASEYAVGAFCGDECRGTGVYVNGVMMINVHGNPGDVISFRYITPENEEMLSVSELTFDENQLYSMSAPYAISLEGSTVAVETVSGSDFDVVIEEGSLSLNGDLSSVISLEVYDLAGNRVAAATKGAASQLKVNELEPGVHIIIVRTADTYIYRKVMVK